MVDVIDLNEERSRREQPDPEHVTTDRYGREMWCFSLSYDHGGGVHCVNVWAYDFADAEARVASMRESLRVDGQVFATVPA